MNGFPLRQIVALFVASAIVLGLFLARGFTLREHARILLGAVALLWLVGSAWTLASAVESAGGWRGAGPARLVLIVGSSLAAAFAPALLLQALGY